ncbi:50S ribosomal protein L11 methyltransferase [Wenzhouxiangella sp. XN79A]|uniref:50S ribosomal protein L11 methyltransferase n=1 Tax=Wenzhouxiangella sp. XN79A TaxID=2724193 RepID=UPI00144AD42E|nr:50S ribosomal protein L11 methyltransferase [Wenzhouxiangella sp. XN79A]NKI35293.1 50S ribosomal protein L11 methyltransferase [Wenzhouxiangella sp. XN79A]
MERYRTVRFPVAPDRLDDAEELLWSLGAAAVTLTDAGDQPLHEPGPGETPMWDASILEALIPASLATDAVRAALAGQGVLDGSAAQAEFDAVPDRDWVRAWMDRYEPMRFGESIWVCPSHREPEPDWPVVVRLDPGLAFGTGTHPTTALCLEWLDGLDLDGLEVVDYGCGSGILAVAAALKGARRVLAIDHDGQALDATRDNAERNGVVDRIDAVLPEDAPDGAATVVVANILAGPLVELADAIAGRVAPGGRLALSGILAEQADRVLEAYRARLRPIGEAAREDWVRLDFERPA